MSTETVTIEITVNGESTTIRRGETVLDLLHALFHWILVTVGFVGSDSTSPVTRSAAAPRSASVVMS